MAAKAEVVRTSLRGAELLEDPVWNKGTAFSREERAAFSINGYIPYAVHTLEQQMDRAWQQYQSKPDDIAKNTFLTSLRDQNQVLYFALLSRHIEEVMPVVYTPTEGDAIANYSRLFRRPEGLFLALPNKETMEKDLLSYIHEEGRENDEIDLIIVSDGEQILGIGDQGAGGIGISTAKAAIYTVCAGINPARTIAVGLDVGTNNKDLLDDPLYVGWKHERVRGEEYDDFVDTFAGLVKTHFPNALLHFEDFGLTNALRLLDKYRPKQSVFNDDIQGTAAVALAAILAGCKITNTKLVDQRFVIHGAGTAGLGIAGQIRSAIEKLPGNMSAEEAAKLFWLVDKDGLIHSNLSNMRDAQKPYARSTSELSSWKDLSDKSHITLQEVVKNVKPTVLIGVSTQAGAFKEEIVKAMKEGTEHPLILPLSNPTKLAEGKPEDIYKWSDGKALIATGSPFPPIQIQGSDEKYIVAECNNALAYPGLVLGVIVSKASRLSDAMIVSGIDALASLSPAFQDNKLTSALLPAFTDSRKVSIKVATAVAMKAVEEGVAREEKLKELKEEEVEEFVKEMMWEPVYRKLEYAG